MWHLINQAIKDIKLLNFHMKALCFVQIMDEVLKWPLFMVKHHTAMIKAVMHTPKQKDEMHDDLNKHYKSPLSTESNHACNAFILLSIIDAVKEQMYNARTA